MFVAYKRYRIVSLILVTAAFCWDISRPTQWSGFDGWMIHLVLYFLLIILLLGLFTVRLFTRIHENFGLFWKRSKWHLLFAFFIPACSCMELEMLQLTWPFAFFICRSMEQSISLLKLISVYISTFHLSIYGVFRIFWFQTCKSPTFDL